ncbi:YceI family protein [Bacillus methanolicus]|uniref:YceI family protein n=1 Tax=Bacillus methanolicus (strain MGA3 / ATCC 53907) TaxID=796606 RepID=I3E8R8_BACMM|nr:YceI family protein [Bacillus methanolicus]AIE60154.1 YceI family protein [Bacillus methanolicus MGA3]EIJ82889.1 YceI family protein [Bacillus methanolicus MGA3]
MAKTKWAIDTAHSSVEFSVKHMMIARVKGSFDNFSAAIEADPTDLTTANIEFNVDAASINTRNNDRDAHLRSADFFDAEKYPSLSFKSTKIVKTDDDEYEVTGDLTIRGVTRQETFTVTFEGQGKDPWGNEKAGFSAEGKINRSDYGLTWNAALETGGVLVGDQIKISLSIEAIKEA